MLDILGFSWQINQILESLDEYKHVEGFLSLVHGLRCLGVPVKKCDMMEKLTLNRHSVRADSLIPSRHTLKNLQNLLRAFCGREIRF